MRWKMREKCDGKCDGKCAGKCARNAREMREKMRGFFMAERFRAEGKFGKSRFLTENVTKCPIFGQKMVNDLK